MTTIPSYRTWVAGEVVVASYFNSNIRDAGNFWLARPLCILRQTSAQTLTTATWTDLLMDTEDIDRDGGHSTVTNPARYTSPTAGYLLLGGGAGFAANATGQRGVRWALNGTTINGTQVFISAVAAQVLTLANRAIFQAVNGTTDYVTNQGHQTSGGNLNTAVTTDQQPSFHILWVSTL